MGEGRPNMTSAFTTYTVAAKTGWTGIDTIDGGFLYSFRRSQGYTWDCPLLIQAWATFTHRSISMLPTQIDIMKVSILQVQKRFPRIHE